MEIENLITTIQDDIKPFKKEEKLYFMIYDFLTQKNQLKNYSTNKTGIRFKLHDFDIDVLKKLIEIIEEYSISKKNENIDFTEEIKVKKKRIKKV
jgi:hypothetical protein